MIPAQEPGAWEREALTIYLARRPYTAAQLGARLTDATRVPVAPGDREALASRAGAVASSGPLAAEEVAPLTVEIVRHTLEGERRALSVPWHEHTVSALPEAGLAAQVLLFLPYAAVDTADGLEQYEAMCAAVPQTLAEGADALERGAAEGRCPVVELIPLALEQVDRYLASPLSEDVLVVPVRERDPQAAARLERIVALRIRPAFEAWAAAVRQARPKARPGERAGVCWLPDGEALYSTAIREFTTVEADPDHLHRVGCALVEALERDVVNVARQLGWEPQIGAVWRRLRTDPAHRFTTREHVLASARSALRRAEERSPQWVGDVGEAPCEVLPMTELEERSGVLGHYEVAPLNRSRPARYWVNTSEPGSRFTFEAEALAFHESVPGHHIELTASLRAPHGSAFRRLVGVMPYTEGWALYAERLADEMGLYSGPVDRLGMLSFALWRASRLVVDTGLHHYGWSRQRAMAFLEQHTALDPRNVANEVDRYIAHPGSALAYQLGERVLQALRELVAPGATRPALQRFHQDLLANGPLPIPLLTETFGVSLSSVFQALPCTPA